MTATRDSDTRPPPLRRDWLGRLKRMRVIIAAAGAVFAALWALGILTAPQALAGFGVIAAAGLIGAADRDAARVSAIEQRPPAPAGDTLVEAVLAALPDPVIALDRQGDVLAANARASAIAPGLRRGEPVSLALRAPEVLDALRRATGSGGAQRVEFFERVPLDRWYEVVVTPVPPAKSAPGLPAGLTLMTFHDLTPLRRVEEMRADFVANASHELRTPLAALSGFIETLQGSARDDAAARERFLGIMQAQATRMARLINDLLSLSRIELNAHLSPDTRTDLAAIVRQVTDSLQTLARDRGVEVRVTAPAEALFVLGDRDELIRVIENLIENALKYAASGKRVEVTLSVDAGRPAREGHVREVHIRVRDYGPGIAPEHLPRLTERFYRVDVAESRAQGGTGLGLALVKHILNRHRGRLSIESTAGQGASFTVHLPLAPDGGDERARAEA